MMMLVQTVTAFLVVLGTLIIFHELGHYWVARLCGVKVLRFSVGMGKVIYSRRFGPDQTEWVISMLPLGGYVKMLDAREQGIEQLSPEDIGREFTGKSVWRRIAIVAAGPIANFILAIAIFCALYSYGVPEPLARIRAVPENSGAFQAGLRGGETLTEVNGERIESWTQFRWQLMKLAFDKLPAKIEARREDGTTFELTLPLAQITQQDLEKDFLVQLGMSLAKSKAILTVIEPHGPAMAAGFKKDDLIVSVDGAPISDGSELIELVSRSPGKSLQMTVKRGTQPEQLLILKVVPEALSINGKLIGKMQVKVSGPEMVVVRSGTAAALTKAIGQTWDSSVFTVKMLGKMIVGKASWKNISGPLTIAEVAGQSARVGIIPFLMLIASVSIGLGVMNLLPIPVLDGGLLLYYSLEVLTGRPVSERFAEIAQRAGVGMLITLMAVAMFNDIFRLIS